jgi:hypothetical protein
MISAGYLYIYLLSRRYYGDIVHYIFATHIFEHLRVNLLDIRPPEVRSFQMENYADEELPRPSCQAKYKRGLSF